VLIRSAVFEDDIEVDVEQLQDLYPGIVEAASIPLDNEREQTARPVQLSELPLPSVQPLVPELELRVADALYREDFATWVQCSRGSDESSCIIQKKGWKTIPVLGDKGLVLLRVRQLKCARHNTSMNITSPYIFKQLWDARIHFQPAIRTLTGSLVVTEEAFM
jgi:hypothetical protein